MTFLLLSVSTYNRNYYTHPLFSQVMRLIPLLALAFECFRLNFPVSLRPGKQTDKK